MDRGFRARRRGLLVIALAAATAAIAAGCGSGGTATTGSAGDAQQLLGQTFSSRHTVRSGVLGFALTLTPSGSSQLTTPVSLSLSGPFASRGAGQVPASDFTLSLAGLGRPGSPGRPGSLGVISTGTHAYVTLDGQSYLLPSADFQRLQSGIGGGSTAATNGGLAELGIDPQRWLAHPAIVGSARLDGVQTTHIRAGVDAPSLLTDLSTFLARTARTTGSAKLPNSISPATRQKLAAAVSGATVDVWTGSSDTLLRRLTLSLDVPVHGQVSQSLGGLRSAAVTLTISYSQINRPQTITAPTHVEPYSRFQAKLGAALAGVSPGLGSAVTGSGTTGSPAVSDVDKYSRCIEQAGTDVVKMQTCARLLNAG